MEYGICILNCIPIRRDAEDQSEMVSQLLFGETIQVIDNVGSWIRIHVDFDHYEGWVLEHQVEYLDEETYKKIRIEQPCYSDEMVTFINDQHDQMQILSLGARLPHFTEQHFNINNQNYFFDGDIITGEMGKINLVNTAYKYLNSPALWGGKTPFGIDCSGFTQMVYKINGYKLLRDAHQQASQGEVLSFIEESEAGDLAYFDNEEGEIIHAGILLADNHIIHCHGKVRIDRIDQSGIYNVDTKKHSHRLRVMKQIF